MVTLSWYCAVHAGLCGAIVLGLCCSRGSCLVFLIVFPWYSCIGFLLFHGDVILVLLSWRGLHGAVLLVFCSSWGLPGVVLLMRSPWFCYIYLELLTGISVA